MDRAVFVYTTFPGLVEADRLMDETKPAQT
jgi:hypothetical protein